MGAAEAAADNRAFGPVWFRMGVLLSNVLILSRTDHLIVQNWKNKFRTDDGDVDFPWLARMEEGVLVVRSVFFFGILESYSLHKT